MLEFIIDEEISPEKCMKILLPHCLHLASDRYPADVYISFKELAEKIKSVASGKHVIYPTQDIYKFDNAITTRLTEALSNIGMVVDPVHISYSPTGKCNEPILYHTIVIGDELVYAIASIDPETANAKTFFDTVYRIATLGYLNNAITNYNNISRQLSSLARVIFRDQFYMFRSIYTHTFTDYLSFKDAMMWVPKFNSINIRPMDAFIDSFLNYLGSWINNNEAQDDVLVMALTLERLISWCITSTTAISIATSVAVILANMFRKPNRPMQEIIAQSSINASKVISGEVDIISHVVSSWVRSMGPEITPSKKTHSSITGTDVCIALEKYITNLKPTDISFDIPEERLAMLVHDLGSKPFTVCEEADTFSHYYSEDGEDESYKLFMLSNSNDRSVYGICIGDGVDTKLIRFSDAAPTTDYVFRY